MRIDGPIFTYDSSRNYSKRVLLARTAITGATATVDFTFPSSGFDFFEVYAVRVTVDTDDANLRCRLSSNGAVLSGATDYEYILHNSIATTAYEGSVGATFIPISPETAARGIGNASGEGFSFRVVVSNLTGAVPAFVQGESVYTSSAGNTSFGRFSGQLISVVSVDGIRFLLDSGNFTSGLFLAYGIGAA